MSVRWLLKWKTDEDKEFSCAKYQLVVRGLMQQVGANFFGTFATTPSACSIRILAGVAVKDVPLYYLDITQGFVKDLLEGNTFKKLPGCVDMNDDIVHLNKSLFR